MVMTEQEHARECVCAQKMLSKVVMQKTTASALGLHTYAAKPFVPGVCFAQVNEFVVFYLLWMPATAEAS